MNRQFRNWWTTRPLVSALCLALLSGQMPAQAPRQYTFRALSELVLVNVTVRDRQGNLVRGLTADDFTVLEDGKPQRIASFDLENTDVALPTNMQQAKVLTAETVPGTSVPAIDKNVLKDRRLVILFFDLSSMQPEEVDRAVKAAEDYVNKQMAPADLVAVASLDSSLLVNQDFTSDHALLLKAVDGFSSNSGQGYEEGSTGTTEGTPETGQPFTPDDTEYNIFNTDRRLEALRALAESMSQVDQKKSIIYFASGMDRTGVENQSELRATINSAVRSNVSIYTLDTRGLEAMVPGGEAQQASLRGTAPYSGKATRNQYNSNFTTQETLVTLAGDTGGRAFLDSNDFSQVFRRVQQDTATYYLLGYRSSNSVRDGRFRRITVRVNRPDLKLVYRRGYYAPADFRHTNREDRENQLEQELASDLPSTDLPVFLSAGYFRLGRNKCYAPVSIVVPGSEIPFSRNKEQDRATIDVLGVVLDPSKHPMARVRDTVKLAVRGSVEVQRKNVQYDTGVLLPPGKFHLKFIVRENQTGRTGSFETDLVIPDMKNAPLKMSTVVLAGQRQPVKGHEENPLVRSGWELVPSVTHVFSSNQQLYLYYEVYDPAPESANDAPGPRRASASSGIHLLTNVAFFDGNKKAYETPLITAQQLNAADRHAAGFQVEVPLNDLKPGFYTCQVNVIDDAAGAFLFPRLALLVRQPGAVANSGSKQAAEGPQSLHPQTPQR
ncbi:MAG TPA: VWA domain-containing protein [Terriglobales bacterium]|nr:VWA domain-containing protein [Terriglobales bacterium]